MAVNGRMRLNLVLVLVVGILAALGYFRPGIKLPGAKV